VSRMVCSTVSAITERPYTFLRWLIGTLPGRKPLRRTLSLRSTSRASALASRSDAGTLTVNSCFNPSLRVSVTCMAFHLLLVWSGLNGRNMVHLVDAGRGARAGGSANPIPPGETGSRAILVQTLKALGAGGGTRTPTTFVTGT